MFPVAMDQVGVLGACVADRENMGENVGLSAGGGDSLLYWGVVWGHGCEVLNLPVSFPSDFISPFMSPAKFSNLLYS